MIKSETWEKKIATAVLEYTNAVLHLQVTFTFKQDREEALLLAVVQAHKIATLYENDPSSAVWALVAHSLAHSKMVQEQGIGEQAQQWLALHDRTCKKSL